jgi:Ca2+/Na+ antiporter
VLSSNAINVTVTPVTNVDPSQIGLILSPNPTSTGEFTIQLETRTRSNLNISLVNTVGQQVYQQTIPGFIGRLTQPVKPGKLAAGIYYLQVIHDQKLYVRKVVVTQ